MFRPTINLANSIVGVSILAMPYCFKECGVLLGALLLMSSAVMTIWSNMMLVHTATFTKKHTYGTLALATFGTYGKLGVELCIIGLNFGTCVAFFVIIGDLAPPIIAQIFDLEHTASLRAVVLVTAAVTIAFPLALLRRIDSLSSISIGSLAFYFSLIVQLVFLSWGNFAMGRWWDGISWWNNAGIFKCLPIFSLSFACQPQMFAIYNDLQNPSVRKMSTVITGSVLIVGTGYSLVAVFGYTSFFQDGVLGDVLSNFSLSLLSQATRLGFALSVVLSFPLLVFPCRISINSLFFSKTTMELNVVEPIPQNRFVGITATIIAFNLFIAILIPHVETVLALTGATMGSIICYICPAIFYLTHMHSSAEYKRRAKFLLAVGLTVSLLSTVVILNSQAQQSGPFHPPQPVPPHHNHIAQPDDSLNISPVPPAPDDNNNPMEGHNEDVVSKDKDDPDRNGAKSDNEDGEVIERDKQLNDEGRMLGARDLKLQHDDDVDKDDNVVKGAERGQGNGEIHNKIADLLDRVHQMEKENEELKVRQDVIEQKQDEIEREEEKQNEEVAAAVILQQAAGEDVDQEHHIHEGQIPEQNDIHERQIPEQNDDFKLPKSHQQDPLLLKHNVETNQQDGNSEPVAAEQDNNAVIPAGVENQIQAARFPNDDSENMAAVEREPAGLKHQEPVEFENLNQINPDSREAANLANDPLEDEQVLLEHLREAEGRGLREELLKAAEEKDTHLSDERRMMGRDLKSQDDKGEAPLINSIVPEGE